MRRTPHFGTGQVRLLAARASCRPPRATSPSTPPNTRRGAQVARVAASASPEAQMPRRATMPPSVALWSLAGGSLWERPHLSHPRHPSRSPHGHHPAGRARSGPPPYDALPISPRRAPTPRTPAPAATAEAAASARTSGSARARPRPAPQPPRPPAAPRPATCQAPRSPVETLCRSELPHSPGSPAAPRPSPTDPRRREASRLPRTFRIFPSLPPVRLPWPLRLFRAFRPLQAPQAPHRHRSSERPPRSR